MDTAAPDPGTPRRAFPTGRFRSILLTLHRDEQGVMSILSVFAVLMLTALLGMVMNAGRQIDGKIRLQNAADATAYSGGVLVARGMNVLAFSNHLMSEVFALTTLMREARDQESDKYIPGILNAWKKAGQIFQKSPFQKFQKLGRAIVQEAPLEQDLVDAFSAWAKAASELMLPTFEEILDRSMIPEFEEAVVRAYPDMAQAAALQAALANGRPGYGRGDLCGALWRTSTVAGLVPVGGAGEMTRSTLPVIGPNDSEYLDRMDEAHEQVRSLATLYVNSWNNQVLAFFDNYAKMCQFATLWRNFTDGQKGRPYPPDPTFRDSMCGQLKKVWDDYGDKNLPHLIRTPIPRNGLPDSATKQLLDSDFTFVGVAYWNHVPDFAPRIFYNPMPAASVAFAQVRVFIPHRRLVWVHIVPSGPNFGGMPGASPPSPPGAGGQDSYVVGREWGVEEGWDLLNQHWTVELVPATHNAIPTILQQPPNVPGFNPRLPNLAGVENQIGVVNTH